MATEKHWATKQTSKQDEVRDLFTLGLDWALRNRRQVAMGAGGVAVVAVLIGLLFYSRAARENEAWDKLSLAEAYSYYGRTQEAANTLAEITAHNANPAASGLAEIMAGDIKHAKGEHDQAVSAYSRAVETAPEALRPFAQADRIAALEAAGKHAECAAAASSFLESNTEHFMGPRIMELLARCQASAGQGDAAKATWQKIALQFPDTPWAARANSRLQPTAK
ncbi:MAG: tetratricopeptide repeat protein [Elusimicrobiota bacterium]